MGTSRTWIVATCLWVGIGAGAPARAEAPPEPWLDAKSVCLFRLGSGREMPENPQQLIVAMADGWKNAILLPNPATAVDVEGGAYPTIDSLSVNLSDGKLRPSQKKDRIHVNGMVEQTLDVSHLQVRAEPLLLHQAKLNMTLKAESAQLELERDRRGRPVMMLDNARSGTLSFAVKQSDLEQLMLEGARATADGYGVEIVSTRLKITAETPRSIYASLHVSTKVAFVPAGMLFKAHVVVDDQMNAKITGLTVDGDEALGPLIVHFLRPSLEKYNGKTKPLIGFPAGKLKLRDVALKVDDSVRLDAAFGS